jgi:hypothetical protein
MKGRPAGALAGLVLLAALTGGCQASRTSRAPGAASPTAEPAPPTTAETLAAASVATTAAAAAPAAGDPGLLPQTPQRPQDDDPRFVAGTRTLWQAIVADDPSLAMGFFFPLTAYLQVKAIADPAHDYQTRLIHYYQEDIHFLHRTLGAHAASAVYAGISVPAFQARWVNPGEEFNRIGYWRVYDAALHYDAAGSAHSLLVTSLISWRGQWYVVHLQAVR